jgi:anti-sigma factor ChrR (cupin superfamily)
MHPKIARLIAYCDSEAGADRSGRIARHLSECELCRGRLRRIRGEKEELSASAAAPALDPGRDLDAVLSAIAAWREGRDGGAASELTSRLQWQLEKYFGVPAMRSLERPGMRAEEWLGEADRMLDVFLGPEAGEAVRDDCLRGLAWVRPAREMSR